MISILKPTFLVSFEDFTLGWFAKTNRFIVLDGLLESFFIQSQEMSEIDFNNSFQALLVEHPSLKLLSETLFVAKSSTIKNTSQKNDYSTIFKDKFIASTLKLSSVVLSTLYQNKKLQTLFQSPYKHLIFQNNAIHHEIMITASAENLDLYFNQKHIYNCKKSEYFILQAQFSNKITEVYHDIKDPDWLCSFHACAVCKSDKTYLLLGNSGAGKSTLSSLLSLSGYRFVADDLVLMDHDFKIFDNPAAVSVKERAWPVIDNYYKNFKNVKISNKTKSQLRMKFLPMHIIQNNRPNFFTIDSLIWVNFSKEKTNNLRIMDKQTALSKLIPDTWINPKISSAKAFSAWLVDIKTLQLDYSDFEVAKKLLDAHLQ